MFIFETLLPKPNTKPMNDKIKLEFVNTIPNASFHVHLAYLVGWYTTPFFLASLFNNVSGLHSYTNNENMNAIPDNMQQIYIECTNVFVLSFAGYQPAAGAIKALITVPNKPPT